MVLNGVKLDGFAGVFNIVIEDAQITSITKDPVYLARHKVQLNLENTMAFPGLINSHDHLEFNLFPQLGNKTYANYVEWGEYIHRHYAAEIASVLNIPKGLRAQWGIYKNLLCGVTTVVDHGPEQDVGIPIITHVNQCQNLHSIRLEKNWRSRLNNPLKLNVPAVIHIGEGTDEASKHEIDELIRWNILQRDLIGIHGVAMSAEKARHFKALIWCPETNYYLLDKTAAIDQLKKATTILFGSDSALTGKWNIWEHIRLARKTGLLTDDELYRSLTTAPASIWKLNTGKIEPGKDADIIIVKQDADSLNPFFDIQPKDILLVVHQGIIRLFDEELYPQLKGSATKIYSKIYINHTCKYVQGDLPALMEEIYQYHAGAEFPVLYERHETIPQ